MNNEIRYSGCAIGCYSCQCFDKLSVDEKKYLHENCINVKYKRGEVICKQGTYASHLIMIDKGLAKVYLDDGVNSLVLKVIPEGNLLGLSSINDFFNTFQYSALAYVDTETKQIEINAFRTLLKNNSEFAKAIIDVLCSNNTQIYSRFFCITHKQSFGRLADIILCLSDRIFKSNEFHLPLTRKDLAELSGMSAETVARMLKKFNDEGLIKTDGKNIKILDSYKLERISEIG